MTCQKIQQRIPGDEILFAEEYRSGECTFVDVATDRGDVRVQEFGYLTGGIEIKVEQNAHLIPKCFSTSSNLLLKLYFLDCSSCQYALWCSGLQNFCQCLLGVNAPPQYRHFGLLSVAIINPLKMHHTYNIYAFFILMSSFLLIFFNFLYW